MIKTKSLKEPTEESDGVRILIARYRPMYLPKSKENWDLWCKQLAPSKGLFYAYVKHKTIAWNEYEERYMNEIDSSPEAQNMIRELSELCKTKDVTLLCHCDGVSESNPKCHRYLVKALINSEN
jgi:uncharacterized protein YeaO (DUF488 family)